jgi:FtsP/CotA-like multicopper oxidase with cupredoxin domain
MTNRRNFLRSAGAMGLGAAAASRVAAASLPEAVTQSSAATQPPPAPSTGRPYNPVVTLNGWSLPWRMKDNVKEFHLVAEPVVRELAPGMKARLWGYNGTSAGPTIEAVEGDRVRIYVTNRLPEPTAVHWHGIRLPNGMDGLSGLNQPSIKPGETIFPRASMVVFAA